MKNQTTITVKRKKHSRLRIWPILLAAAVLLIVGLAAAAAGFFGMRRVALSWFGGDGVFGPNLISASATPALNALGTPIPPVPGGDPQAPPVQLAEWDGAGRVTVLLLGLDFRDWEKQEEEASRSDTMILLTLDPQTKTAGVLSIPRDLWVAIPGFKHGKINTAYYLGDAYEMPGGGPALAVKTVEQFLGVPINYYAQIDFAAFVRFIDEIGGVEVDVPAPIKIDILGDGPRTIKNLKAGAQVLPGDYALAYARNRKTENGDFDRAARQQQVILGIRNQILDYKMLPTLVTKAPTLYADLASGIRTNLQLDEVIQLALMAEQVPEESIKRGIINKDNVMFGESPDGLSILVPLPDDIHNLRDEIFTANSSLGPQAPGDIPARMKAEAARVAIYNGSGDAALANQIAEYLRSQGMNVVQVGDAGQPYAATTIIDHSGSPYALGYLVERFGIAPARISIEFQPNASVDVELFLGSDAAAASLTP